MKTNKLTDTRPSQDAPITEELSALVAAFAEAARLTSESMVETGRKLVLCLDAGASKAQIAERTGYDVQTLDAFELIGRGQVYYRLFDNQSAGFRAARALPYSDQVRVFEESLPVLEESGEHKLRKLQELTPWQVRQVIDRGHLRSLGEQRAWLDTERTRRRQSGATGDPVKPYKILSGRRVQLTRDAIFDHNDLAMLLMELK